nr:HlyD family type I secretion periplasmic adaptor subunit [Motiliproteus sp. SC1-56]
MQPSRRSRLLLWTIVAFSACALAWATVAELDEVTRGEGRVIPSQHIQVVQNLEGGILKQVLVREGDPVERGQPLLLIDDTRFRSDYREHAQEANFMRASAARLQAELASIRVNATAVDPDAWQTQVQVLPVAIDFGALDEGASTELRALMQRERAQLEERLRNLSNQLKIIERQIDQRAQEKKELISKIRYLATNYRLGVEELQMTRPLAEEGVVPRVELIKLEREVNLLKSELESSRLMLPKVEAARLENIDKRLDVALQHRSESQSELNEVQAKLAQMSEGVVSLEDRVKRTTVASPVRGTVKRMAVNTVGGVIQPGMDLVEIVPTEDHLMIEARILPKDIAFLRPGLETMVRFTAYDFASYGGLNGTLEHISADSIEDEKGDVYYLIRVRTETNTLDGNGGELPIIPGMTATVDVLTGRKTILDYLLKPILRAQTMALTER